MDEWSNLYHAINFQYLNCLPDIENSFSQIGVGNRFVFGTGLSNRFDNTIKNKYRRNYLILRNKYKRIVIQLKTYPTNLSFLNTQGTIFIISAKEREANSLKPIASSEFSNVPSVSPRRLAIFV
ncbi:hypothetical protein BpHYR1_039065 [Brachionus plicatilis]|uniref:Uncharacterized protein n=1 Tax=Brachionus plicatilis TaxID=10195 RepID=A0A3M7RBJ0_BRAPC|nr:hypothetical protein BpHYR1_039065 [Brachionus plicatilis]